MPVYEYLCRSCGRRFSRFFWRISDSEGARCRCGSGELEQLVSRVSMLRSEESRMERLSDPGSWDGVDESDPKSMARMMRKMSSEMGEDLGPEFDEALGRLEAGEDPEAIEQSLGGPDRGGAFSDGDDLF